MDEIYPCDDQAENDSEVLSELQVQQQIQESDSDLDRDDSGDL